jgi:hypothetical protein
LTDDDNARWLGVWFFSFLLHARPLPPAGSFMVFKNAEYTNCWYKSATQRGLVEDWLFGTLPPYTLYEQYASMAEVSGFWF